MRFSVHYLSLEKPASTRQRRDDFAAFKQNDWTELQKQLGADELLFVPNKSLVELYLGFSETGDEQALQRQNEQSTDLLVRIARKAGLLSGHSHPAVQSLHGEEAVRHFFRSTLGWLPSGEHQRSHAASLRHAYTIARDQGLIGILMNRLYQRALWLHEKIRLETDFFDQFMALAPAIVEVAGKIFGDFSKSSCLIVGTNFEAISTAQALHDAKIGNLTFVARRGAEEKELFRTVSNATFVSCEPAALQNLDVDLVLIFESFCTQFGDKAVLQNFMAKRHNAPLLLVDLVDLARPQDLSKTYNLFYFQRQDLNRIIEQNLQERQATDGLVTGWIQDEIEQFYKWYASDERFHFSSMVGRSQQMQAVFELIARVARTDITVLIQGGSGTGKELVAKAVHEESGRADKPFVVVNCGAIPENLLESELFGHVRGAFTGAINNKKGLFEEANSGTIFLDEIGELNAILQVKLLRFLQEGEIKRVGSNSTIHLNVRVIAATNRNLQEMVDQNEFRSDLFYRLNVIQIDLPPLKDRPEDIILLARYFLKKFSMRMRKTAREISEPAMEKLVKYSWPGNVRELENVMERAVALSTDREIGILDLPENVRSHTAFYTESNGRPSLKEVERRYIYETLDYCRGNHDETARVLGIGRTTLWRKLKEYQIEDESD